MYGSIKEDIIFKLGSDLLLELISHMAQICSYCSEGIEGDREQDWEERLGFWS